jgi:DNA-binding GntR family transcriptional regulator
MASIFDVANPVVARSASDQAAELIRDAITDGRLEPGARLKEERLAGDLGLSRTPVREALQRLSTEGLVEIVPNRGAFVRSYDPGELEELYDMRALLEGHAASLAATRISVEQLDLLRASCERFEALGAESPVEALVLENGRFHETILEAAGSELLAGMIQQVIKLPLVYRSYVWYSPDQKRTSERDHRRLVDSFERRDPHAAEAIMREHVLGARDVLLAHLRSWHTDSE